MADQLDLGEPGGYDSGSRGGSGGGYGSNKNDARMRNYSIPSIGSARYSELLKEPLCYNCGIKHQYITSSFCFNCRFPKMNAGFKEEVFKNYQMFAIESVNHDRSNPRPSIGSARYSELLKEPLCYNCGTKHEHPYISFRFCVECGFPKKNAGFKEEVFKNYQMFAIEYVNQDRSGNF